MSEKHSLIGASSAERWMNCPGSVRLYAQLIERRTTEYAATGTAAHEVCERCLKTGAEPLDFLGEKIAVGDTTVEVTEAMVQAVATYVGKIRLDKHRFGGELVVEQSFDLGWLYPGMFGRNDASLIPGGVLGTLRVYDYKNGRKHVVAAGNPQLMYYGLGALGKDNPHLADKVLLHIIQPNAFGKEPIDVWETTADELIAWGHDVLVPAAKATEAPEAPCRQGDWCCFCEAAHLCPARQDSALALLDECTVEHPVATLPAVDALTPERIGLLSAFFQSEEFTAWVKALAAAEQAALANGVNIPGRKLVETTVQGNRRWADEAAVTAALADLGDALLVTKLKSPAQVEAVLKARGFKPAERKEKLDPLVTRDLSTKVIVVNDTDPRAALADKRQNAIDML